tara:strand:+ start:982 stop:1320 length:339 start_codon:yes stop_codon:yes gene_type:complete
MFMLKAKKVRLSNGEELSDVTVLLIDEGISVVSQSTVRIIYHQSILELVFEDSASVHFMKGRNLAHWMRDVEDTKETLEEFEYDFSELEAYIQGEIVSEEETEKDTQNPYAE